MSTSYDQGMDVYVVSKMWDEPEGGIVLGAGADLADAQVVADRWNAEPFAWGEWVRDPGVGVRSERWTRSDGVRKGGQEIVKVPLAGSVFATSGPPVSFRPETAGSLRDLITTQPPAVSPSLTIDALKQHVVRLQALHLAEASRMRVGTRAWDWLSGVLDKLTGYPSETALPDSVRARMYGVDVVRDPNVPPDQIRIGSVVHVIGTEENGVGAGQMLAYDEATLERQVRVAPIQPTWSDPGADPLADIRRLLTSRPGTDRADLSAP